LAVAVGSEIGCAVTTRRLANGWCGAARAKHFGDARPGSATIIVKALVNPAWLIEIEAVAAGAARAR
jgi:hypothetical protein